MASSFEKTVGVPTNQDMATIHGGKTLKATNDWADNDKKRTEMGKNELGWGAV